MVERPINVGDHVEPGQVVAKLEPQDELNALRTAQASVAAAQGQLNQAQKQLRASENAAGQGHCLARAVRAGRGGAEDRAGAARYRRGAVEGRQGSGQLHRVAGRCRRDVVTTGAEAGEVVQAGQMIMRVARKDGRDAVFDVPAQLLRSAPSDPLITVSLTDDPAVTAHRTRAGGLAAGRPGDPDLRGQGRPDRSARGDAARRDGRWGA